MDFGFFSVSLPSGWVLCSEENDGRCDHTHGSKHESQGLVGDQVEEYLVQGVILLRTFPKDGRLVRVFQVEKMRGLAIDNQPRPYGISTKGIEVYPIATVYK
jgi:KaiC/GvpD/RAD55 family RecA-like ATPase